MPLRVGDVARHRQQRFEARSEVATDPIRLIPADGDEPSAEVAGGCREGVDLLRGQGPHIDIDEHGRVEPGESIDRWKAPRVDGVDPEPAGAEGACQCSSFTRPTLRDEHPGGAIDLHGRPGSVVFSHRVHRRLHLDLIPRHAMRVRRHDIIEGHRRVPRRKIHLLGGDLRAISAEPDASHCRLTRRYRRPHRDALAGTRPPRCVDVRDGHIRTDRGFDDVVIDDHAGVAECGDLGGGVAIGRLAI